MQYQLTIGEQKIACELRKLRRSRHLRLTMRRSGGVLVTLPWRAPFTAAEAFLHANRDWIATQLARVALPVTVLPTLHQVKARALTLITARLRHFNSQYGFTYRRVTIRKQTSRWGSCSSRGNLNFNYKLFFLDSALLDYVVVHELCHLAEPNHSPAFWQLVSRALPDYALRRRALRAAPV